MKAQQPSDSPYGEFLLAAWRRLGGREPRELEALRALPDRKNSLYRLVGAGEEGGSVFAKLCRRANAEIEPAVYAEVLSRLPISVPQCYGTAVHEEGVWVFIEDVGTERADPGRPEHRALAARWLARMHLTTSRLELAGKLPDRGPTHYLEMLRTGRRGIVENRANPAYQPGDREIIDALLAQLGELEERWDGIEEFCADLPRALVHGDFRPKNAHVRTTGEGLALYPMDWETAGWGVPAADLASARQRPVGDLVDLTVYGDAVRGEWPSFDATLLRRLHAVGGVFRRLAAIEWATYEMPFPYREYPISLLRCYREGLEDLLRERLWAA